MEKDPPLIEMNKDQVVRIINFIESSQPAEVKKDIFTRLGQECFDTGHTRDWGMSFGGDYQKFLDSVNVAGNSPYWEKLEFNADKTILHLTGKKVSRCVCAFARSDTPPQSLCLHCCKTFQENLYGTVFKRKVRVEITESSILGGSRCSTDIHLL